MQPLVLPHCKHVFFAGCHDEGYVSFLSPYKLDKNIAPKITLIETHNTMPKYHDLGFAMTSFPNIFREQDFPPPGSATPSSPPPLQPRSHNIITASSLISPQPAAAAAAAEKRPSTPMSSTNSISSWASVGKASLPPNKTIDIAPAKRTSGSSGAPGGGKKYYLVNKDSERVDEPMRTPPSELFERYNARIKTENRGLKFCNTCNFFGPDRCSQKGDFRHGAGSLSPAEFEVYRFLVRTTRCPSELWCERVDCPYSHHCKFGASCERDYECKFVDTHYMSRVSASGWVVVSRSL